MVMPPTCSGEDLGARGAVWVGTHFPKRIATAGAFGSTLSQRHGLFLVVVGVTGVAVATVIVFAVVVCDGGVRWWCAVVVCGAPVGTGDNVCVAVLLSTNLLCADVQLTRQKSASVLLSW